MSPEKVSTVKPSHSMWGEGYQDWTLASPHDGHAMRRIFAGDPDPARHKRGPDVLEPDKADADQR